VTRINDSKTSSTTDVFGQTSRGGSWLFPTAIHKRTLVFGWLSLITEISIVGTGGAVRLTASGLGCPTWPQCTADSLVPTGELGIHGAIEFGNRMMTFVVGVIAIITFLLVLRLRKERPELFRLALWLGLGVVAQGVIGGITVLTGLNSYIVGAHFIVSALLVAAAAALVYFLYRNPAEAVGTGTVWYRRATVATAVFVALTVVFGVLTTGSGPHSGDESAARNGFNVELWEHLHSYPGYIALALTIVILAGAYWQQLADVRRFAWLLTVVTVVQALVGVAQARLGLPGLLVGIHMVLACIIVAAMTATTLSIFRAKPAMGAEPRS
jgi:cytochrome c oxidase assembly protein subunit 15